MFVHHRQGRDEVTPPPSPLHELKRLLAQDLHPPPCAPIFHQNCDLIRVKPLLGRIVSFFFFPATFYGTAPTRDIISLKFLPPRRLIKISFFFSPIQPIQGLPSHQVFPPFAPHLLLDNLVVSGVFPEPAVPLARLDRTALCSSHSSLMPTLFQWAYPSGGLTQKTPPRTQNRNKVLKIFVFSESVPTFGVLGPESTIVGQSETHRPPFFFFPSSRPLPRPENTSVDRVPYVCTFR